MAEAINSTVLIAVDFSEFSTEAFNWYADRFHRDGNKVLLVHCIEMPSMPSRDTWESQTRAGKEKAMELKRLYTTRLQDKGIAATFMYHFEKPGEFITKTAKTEGVNVIVMGTRGMGKVRRTFLGSVSKYVLDHAECPVLVCRSTKDSA